MLLQWTRSYLNLWLSHLRLSQEGGGTAVFTSSSAPGEVSCHHRQLSTQLNTSKCIWPCTAPRPLPFSLEIFPLNVNKMPLLSDLNYNASVWIMHGVSGFGSLQQKEAAACSWLIQGQGFVSSPRSMCKQHFQIAEPLFKQACPKKCSQGSARAPLRAWKRHKVWRGQTEVDLPSKFQRCFHIYCFFSSQLQLWINLGFFFLSGLF